MLHFYVARVHFACANNASREYILFFYSFCDLNLFVPQSMEGDLLINAHKYS